MFISLPKYTIFCSRKLFLGKILGNSEKASLKKFRSIHLLHYYLGLFDTQELIFGVIFTIRGHWKALESKITKIQNCSSVPINIDPLDNKHQGTYFWSHLHDTQSLGDAREQNNVNNNRRNHPKGLHLRSHFNKSRLFGCARELF